MKREAFFDRVRNAVRSAQRYRVNVQQFADRPPRSVQGGDLAARLAQEITTVGGTAHVAEDLDDARRYARGLFAENNVQRALCWQHSALEELRIDELLDEADVTAIDHATLAGLPREAQRREMLAADLGITGVDFAVAETGSLLLAAAAGRERVAALVPPVHFAIVRCQQIVADLFDAFERFDPRALPSNLTFITGPSKTGDIELQLTTGVHGPGAWHVLVVP